jgi:branched-chain amino acid transport system ATP-binding protein
LANETALTLAGVDALYGDSQVLHGVGFSVRAGTVLALLGRNGAGKSTCISRIMGLLAGGRGRIALFGEAIERASPERIARLGVGLVPQGRRVFATLSVKENLDVAKQPPRHAGCAAWTMARVFELFPRLSERRHQAAGSLSGGEQQMLAIARALMGNPRVLLLDEPSEGLAPQIVAEVSRTIALLKAEGLTIVLVEQNLRLAVELSDDAVVINTGHVVFAGSTSALRADPALIEHHLGMH